ncbi:TetR/AcrR family transcriptional regulator [Granulicella arctica]|uniref:TetR/AcrR family transcriptional regulator n=1 Tax=Granulicella arctica TaxID=940613 RepID=UPI0021DFC4E6|nr:TetR/AcrR family transcriptional regulator [Granulicella arctica]
MRITRQKVVENREHLLQTATDQFREHGIDGVGVADLMKAAGMSLGSFYGYFESKDQLVAETFARAVGATKDLMVGFLSQTDENAYMKMVNQYLSPGHRDNLPKGCVLAALGSEVTHQSGAVRHAATEQLRTLFDETAQHLPGRTGKQRHDLAIATLASLVGGLILSRMVDEPDLSKQVLDAVKASMKQSTMCR